MFNKRSKQEIKENKKRYKNLYNGNYQLYLRSPHWIDLKRRYKKDRCELCLNRERLDFHHTTYDGITNEKEWELITLCRLCHKASHVGIMGTGKTRNPSKALARIVRRLRNNNKPKLSAWSLFLRRRYGIGTPKNKHPKFKYFKKLAKKEMYRVHNYWNDSNN